MKVILHHGLFGFDKLQIANFTVHYWGTIPQLLERMGHQVYLSKVSKTGTIATRANELKHFIVQNNLQEAAIIAHSLGGLDARHMLQDNSLPIPTLISLGSPHRGSEFMDLLHNKFGLGTRYHPQWARNKPIHPIFHWLDMPAYGCLTTAYGDHFDKITKSNSFTKYYSIGASFECTNTSLDQLALDIIHAPQLPMASILRLRGINDIMGLLERITFHLAGPNDGLVSLQRAQYSHYVHTLHGSHWDLVDKSGRFGHSMLPSVKDMYELVHSLL